MVLSYPLLLQIWMRQCRTHEVFACTRFFAVSFCTVTLCSLFIIEGRKTFPRARRTQGNSFRSPVSFSPTDHSLSTSSGSSVFTPEYEDNRMRRRGSDIDNPTLSVMDISPPSRCKFCPLVNPTVKLLLFNYIMSKPSMLSKHMPLHSVFISLIGEGQDYAHHYFHCLPYQPPCRLSIGIYICDNKTL